MTHIPMTPKEWVDSTLDEFGNPPGIVSEMLVSLEGLDPNCLFKLHTHATWIDEARSHLAIRAGQLQ